MPVINKMTESHQEDSSSEIINLAISFISSGRIDDAEQICVPLLNIDANCAAALHLLAVIAQQRGQIELSMAYAVQAVALSPLAAPYHNTLGNLLRAQGRADEAVASFQTALRLRPQSPEIHCNLGTALKDIGCLDQAITHYRQAAVLCRDLPEVWYNLANALLEAGEAREAESWYREALRLRPDYSDAHYNRANALVMLCRINEAQASYRTALCLRPHHPETLNNLGVVLQECGQLDQAEVYLRAAIRLRPGYAEAHYNLGCLLRDQNYCDDALISFQHALECDPGHGAARLALCMAQLPILYIEEQDIPVHRASYEQQLRQLTWDFQLGVADPALADAVGSSQPFFLSYQGYNDRTLQSLYGDLMVRLAAAAPFIAARPAPARSSQRLRVGIVSGFFYDHTIWHLLLRGWLGQMDRSRFELFCYHTGTRRDAQTDQAAEFADRLVEGRRSAACWRDLILADAPHILLYPEIGMDPMSARLAAHRLAPVQCVAWGHPVTTGLPTIDYFLSSDLMEPKGAEEHYTERLVRLPNLATYYEPAVIPSPENNHRTLLGLRPTATVYWSGQALYKYLPQYDDVFPNIALHVPDSQFVFIKYAKSRHVTDQFQARLSRVFAAHGLNADFHCRFLPPMSQQGFLSAVGQSDIVLDTIGWSGGKSTLDCVSHDLPFVTLPGALMRSRHTAAILDHMGIWETVAGSLDEYIAIAIRLARNPGWRSVVTAKLRLNRAKLFRDQESICALEAFIIQAVRDENADCPRQAVSRSR